MTENTTTKKTFAERAAVEPTELHKRFADWLKEQTGVDVDLKTVQLVTTLRMDFQKSDDNQTALAERKAKAAEEAAKKATARKAKLIAELAKLNGETVVAEPVKVEAPVVEKTPEDKAADAAFEKSRAQGGDHAEAAEAAQTARKAAAAKPAPAKRVRRTAATK